VNTDNISDFTEIHWLTPVLPTRCPTHSGGCTRMACRCNDNDYDWYSV